MLVVFFSDIATHIGVEVVFIRPLSVCQNFWWLVATLFPGLSLFFASGLPSPGLLGCLALCLRYADLLYLWLCAHSLLDQGIRGPFACPSPYSLLWFCKFRWALFSPMVHTLRDGITPAGSKVFCPRSERRFSVFPFPLGCFFMLSLPLGMKSPYGSAVGWARPPLVVGAAPFLLMVGLRTSV